MRPLRSQGACEGANKNRRGLGSMHRNAHLSPAGLPSSLLSTWPLQPARCNSQVSCTYTGAKRRKHRILTGRATRGRNAQPSYKPGFFIGIFSRGRGLQNQNGQSGQFMLFRNSWSHKCSTSILMPLLSDAFNQSQMKYFPAMSWISLRTQTGKTCGLQPAAAHDFLLSHEKHT